MLNTPLHRLLVPLFKLVSAVCYSTKWFFAFIYFHIFFRRRKRFGNFEGYCLENSKTGIIPTTQEFMIDRPQTLFAEEHEFDSMTFWGVDLKGSSILVRISRKLYRTAEVWLYLNLAGVGEFQLPVHPDINVYNVDGKSFFAAGLKFQVLAPMRKWRISFNGLLRKGKDISSEDSLIEVKFSFIWTAMAKAFDYNSDFATSTFADAVAQNTWTLQLLDMLYRYNYDKYEHCGQMYGTITLPNEEETVFLFRGSRIHSFGCFNAENIIEYVDIKGFMEGFTVEGCTTISPISSCNLNLDTWMDNRNFSLIFRSDSTTRKLNVEVETECGVSWFSGEQRTKRLWSQPANLLLGAKRGQAIIQCCRANDEFWSLPPKRQSVPLISFIESPVQLSSPLVVDLENRECRNPLLVGGKGASLASLASVSFYNLHIKVPRALCLTTQAYRCHLNKSPRIGVTLMELHHIAWKRTEGDLQQACDRAMESIVQSSIPIQVQDTLEKSMWKLFGSSWQTKAFAVRSSAVGEDSSEISAAGQNSTYLGIVGLKQLLEAVVKCWASQFSISAVQYKRQNGQLLDPGMGVVIQEMISAEAAGVMFTQHPVTGNPNIITITANYGLGESVVSASVEPDTIQLTRSPQDNLTVLKKSLGKKKMKIVLQDGGGTEVEPLIVATKDKFCISDETAIQLGRIGIIVEQWTGGSRDIEWAVTDGAIYLLQARPITSGDEESEFELIHEFDGVVRTDNEYFTTANLGEVFPECLSPLTVSVITKTCDLITQKMIDKTFPIPGKVNPYCNRFYVTFYGKVMINCLDYLYSSSARLSPTKISAVELAFFGRTMDNSHIIRLAAERNSSLKPGSLSSNLAMGVVVFRNYQLLKAMEKLVEKFKSISTNFSTSQEIYDYITNNIFPQLFMVFLYYGWVNAASVVWNFAAISLFWNEDKDSININDFFCDLSSLLLSETSIESADVPTSLQLIAKTIADDQDCQKFTYQMNEQEALDWLKYHPGKAGEEFRQFLEKHGHRCLLEYALETKSWSDNPKPLISVLQGILKSPNGLKPKKRSSIKETIENLTTPLPFWKKYLLYFIVSKCRKAVELREQSKSIVVRCIHCLKRAYQDLTKQMTSEGRIPDPELIWYFTHTEIGSLLQTRSAKMIAKAFRRRQITSKLKKFRFPEIMKGIPEPEKDVEFIQPISGEVQVTGTPVYRGIVRGTAKVILKLEDASTIQSGDILITNSIDIAWSTYFPLLSGVVTELGGIISHGAVIAREYGLPCLIGAQRATLLFRTGDSVILNATSGLIIKDNS